MTVVDWTAAIRAEPTYDLAFIVQLLANPPLDAHATPLDTVIRSAGVRLARTLFSRYRVLSPHSDLGSLHWYRAFRGARILIEAASRQARPGPGASAHPFAA